MRRMKIMKMNRENQKKNLCKDCGKYKKCEESATGMCKRCYNKIMKWNEARQKEYSDENIKRKACEHCGKKILKKDKKWSRYVQVGSCKKCYNLFDKWITGIEY
jgi:hypothetical protein